MRNSLFAAALLVAATSSAEPLTVRQLIDSIKLHHPVIQAANARREQVFTERQSARGEFDFLVEQNTLSRTSGFYDGQSLNQTITKPLETAGAEITAGYRVSDGIFPTYENILNTQSGGELSAGIKFSLLRDRAIDSRRTQLLNADTLQVIGVTQQQIAINNLLFDGVQAYLRWYEAFLKTETLKHLVDLAIDRQAGIESRVANGDLAAITLTEFETTLLTRQIAFNESTLDLKQAEQRVLFFWRQATGEPYQVESIQMGTRGMDWPFAQFEFNEIWQQQVLAAHPELIEMDSKIELAQNDLNLAENQYLPELDLEVKVARDVGNGSDTLDGTESYVGLTFSVPIERNKAKAAKQKANAKLRELKFDRQAKREKLRIDLVNSLKQLDTLIQLNQLRRDQVNIANKLREQEYTRFAAGDSDQFLLNAREAAAGQAEIRAIETEVSLLRQQLGLVALSFDLMTL